MKKFSIVVAASSENLGIGTQGNLPWRIKGDMDYFKCLTSTCKESSKVNAVIMGRKTWESIPTKFRPLPNRLNVVLSRSHQFQEQIKDTWDASKVVVSNSLIESLEMVSKAENVEGVFVIGGGLLYAEALTSEYCSKVFLTEVTYGGPAQATYDTFFPEISARKFRLFKQSPIQVENDYSYRFSEYDRIVDITTNPLVQQSEPINLEEQAYLDIVKDIINNGVQRGDRTGTGTLSKFGVQMRFNLRNNVFPLLTTKKVFWRGVAEELLWFISGCTNANVLRDKDIHIWDGNGSKEFLTKLGFVDREEGDLGPVYGFQVRE